MKKKILIIDDEELIRLSLSEGMKDYGYAVETADNCKSAIEKIQSFRPDVALIDLKLGHENGLELADQIKELDDFIEIIMMTAYGDIRTAIEAIKRGASDFLKKPLDLEEMNVAITKALSSQVMKRKLEIYEQRSSESANGFIGKSAAMRDTVNKMQILSKNDSVTVLIRGETGTGKEVVANYIHQNSQRHDNVLLSLNCAAIPSQLIESELFGFEKNAFSGAGARKRGLVELADGGTLFLDELGEMPLDIQAKLLRFLETKKFKRVGGLESIEVDIRVIAATNRDLEKAIEEKTFREDLYYRLNVVPILLPPLRERGEDIEHLAHHFLDTYLKKFGKESAHFTQEAIEWIKRYKWPGNVRELKNIIERMVILNDVPVFSKEHLPYELVGSVPVESVEVGTRPSEVPTEIPQGFSLEDVVETMEVSYIKTALRQCGGNLSNTAKVLGISRYALKRRMEKYNME